MMQAGQFETSNAVGTALPLREELGAALDRLSRLLVQRMPDPLEGADGTCDPEMTHVQAEVRFLGQVASGWPHVPENALLEDGRAGYGSTVEVEDAGAGTTESYTLMAGALLDIDAGQVSLASPLGYALLGARPGMEITVETPQRRRVLRVLSVITLRQRLHADLRLPAPG